ncbi:PREDICTED: olfactory receptor 8G2-like [Bison bison bison]|uniref:Olfactory receptor 8G2-like n=1 Tax=Bison bison bison TaxID=43346 RepID=A0A6P3GE61_BISBB|nr:PREDICTED: olfactory receptor 8G2-like [Bison bison bison]
MMSAKQLHFCPLESKSREKEAGTLKHQISGIYVVMVVGNQGMITLTGLSSHLHTPMYYFLSNLSFIDLCQSTVITPKMLVSFVTEKNVISYPECLTQLYFFLLFIIAESYMLAKVAYDSYVAICNPLLYNAIVSYYSIYFNKFLALVYSSFNVLMSALTILISYIFSLYKTFHIHSTEGRSKAFSTCSSHIPAVAVFYGSATFMYLQSSSVSPWTKGLI